MGGGIAQLALQSGFTVYLQDLDDKILNRAHARISRGLEKKDQSPLLARLHSRTKIAELNSADCAIEAALEDLEVKRKVFRDLEKALPPDALLATNTSSLSVNAVAEGLRFPERVLGLHFFNPPPVMKLVELIPAKGTAPEAVEAADALAKAMGKTVVRAADSPGFVANRVSRPFYLVAMRLLEAGKGTPAALDRAVREGGGLKMGPFELIDFIGLDVNLAISRVVYEGLGKPPHLAPEKVQAELVRRGCLGRKSGSGFYVYGGDEGPKENPALKEIVPGYGRETVDGGEVLRAVVRGVIEEANHAYAQGVASREDIDLVMRLGMNWPRGPFEWEAQLGSKG